MKADIAARTDGRLPVRGGVGGGGGGDADSSVRAFQLSPVGNEKNKSRKRRGRKKKMFPEAKSLTKCFFPGSISVARSLISRRARRMPRSRGVVANRINQ